MKKLIQKMLVSPRRRIPKKMKNIVIINWRQRNNLTQQEVADKLQITRQQFQNIESGRSIPRLEVAFSIQLLIQLPIEQIFSGTFNKSYYNIFLRGI